MNQKVYTNRTLNMKKIQAIGFDMDFTLVDYDSYNFQKDTHSMILKNLVKELDYPKEILQMPFDDHKIIRGLVIDNQKGHFLKLSRYRSIRQVFNGETVVHYNSRRKIYPTDYIDFDLNHPRFSFIESHFLIPSSLVYMQMVELKKQSIPLPDLPQMFKDTMEMDVQIHNEHSMKKLLMENPKRYIKTHPQIAQNLEKLIKHKKTLFLVTNSNPIYTSFLLNYTINPYLKEHSSWLDLFKISITSAQKPDFFYTKNPFQAADPKTLKKSSETIELSSGFYQGGNAEELTKYLKLKDDEILYIGDQVYTDVVLLKKRCGWRTALVISELVTEKEQIKNNVSLYNKIKNLMEKKTHMEDQVEKLISDRIENKNEKNENKINSLLKEIKTIDLQLQKYIEKINKNFNPYWGELMRVGTEESLFASQAERFSCIYMSKIMDFLSQSPRTYYRAQKRLLPHEM